MLKKVAVFALFSLIAVSCGDKNAKKNKEKENVPTEVVPVIKEVVTNHDSNKDVDLKQIEAASAKIDSTKVEIEKAAEELQTLLKKI